MRHTMLETEVGTLLAIGDGDHVTGLFMYGRPHVPPEERWGKRDPGCFESLAKQMRAYFAGEIRAFDVPLRTHGTPFQRKVWSQLGQIPYAETRSYLDIARAIGSPRAVRAVGAANGKNPISIVIPCHRVIGARGAITGYAGGVERKRWLLDHEAKYRA